MPAWAFVAAQPFGTSAVGFPSAKSSWCPSRARKVVQLKTKAASVVRNETRMRSDVSIAETILRALKNEFKGRDVSRVAQSFKDVVQGNSLEDGQGTERHQRASSFVRGLDSTPFCEDIDTNYKWVRHLETNWETIAKELKQITVQKDIEEKGNNIWAPPVVEAANAYGPDWRTLVLQDREWDPINTKLFPKTTAILKDKDANVPSVEAFFARQAPDTGIKLHTDDCNFILTMHLALSAPKQQSWIEVAGERRYWENGKGLVFNTSFFHRTMNESKDEERLVLLVRFWHPQLTQDERDALSFLFQAIDDPDGHPALLKAERELRTEKSMLRGKNPNRSRTGGGGFGR